MTSWVIDHDFRRWPRNLGHPPDLGILAYHPFNIETEHLDAPNRHFRSLVQEIKHRWLKKLPGMIDIMLEIHYPSLFASRQPHAERMPLGQVGGYVDLETKTSPCGEPRRIVIYGVDVQCFLYFLCTIPTFFIIISQISEHAPISCAQRVCANPNPIDYQKYKKAHN